MKIIKCETFPISIPLKKSFGKTKSLTSLVLKVYTDEGIVGLGEMWFRAERVFKYILPAVIGQDPFEIKKINERMDQIIVEKSLSFAVKAGIDIALYDIVGKALVVPVYKLLGGTNIGEYPVINSLTPRGTTEDMLEDASEYVKEGFKTFKIKIWGPPERDLANVYAVKEAFPDVNLRVDANQRYTPEQAFKVCKELDKLGLELMEQPVSKDDYETMAKLTASFKTPISACEMVENAQDLRRVIEHKAASFFNIKLLRSGGLTESIRMAVIGEEFDIPYYTSGGETDIGAAAAMHFIASVKHAPIACEQNWVYLATDSITEETLAIGNGVLKLPNKPGLGVELNEDKLKQYLINR